MGNRRTLQATLLCMANIFVLHANAQTIATTMTLTANPSSILFGGSSVITATVIPASGPVSDLTGVPIQFFSGTDKPMTMLGGDGTADFFYTYNPAVNNPALVVARSPGGQGQYGEFFGPSSGMVTLNIVGPNAILEGPYTFLFKGLVPSDGAPVGNTTFAAGILVADGNGKLTGEMDINSRFGASFGPVTGTYVLDDSGTGKMTLTTPLGVQHFDVGAPAKTFATIATLVPTDENALFGAATLTLQPASALANYPPNGTYWMDILGETACVDCTSTGHSVGLITGAGTSSFGYGSVDESLEETFGTKLVNAPGSSGHVLSYQGSSSPIDTLGRFTFQLALPANAFPDQPVNFAGYIVDNTHVQVLSIDSHATHMLLLQTLRH